MGNKWPVVTLSEYITIKHGYAFKGEYFHSSETENILVTPGNFCIGGGFKIERLKYYLGPIQKEYLLKEGNLIVTMTDLSKDADTLGYPALIPSLQGKKFLHNQRIGLIEFKNNHIYKDFLFYLLCGAEYRNHVLSGITGTTVKHTSPSKILSFTFNKPPFEVQRLIASYLACLDKKITINKNINKIFEKISQSIFKSWFVDFDPVIDNALDEGNPIPEALQSRAELRQKVRKSVDFKPLPADIRALFPAEFEETELGCVPKGWKISTAGDELVVKGGSTPSTSNADFWENGTIHWTSPKDLAGNDSKVLLDTSKKITELGLIKISSGLLPTDTVLMSSRAPIGYLALAKTPMAINQGYIAIPSSKNLSPEYIIYWLENIMDDIKGMAGGTTFAEISKSAFKTINLVIPSKNIIAEFTRLAHQHFEKVVSNTRQITALTNLRDTLLPKLISGELSLEDLPDIIKQTEAA
ncbi:restriction endonuclease subunit S [Enterobacter sp. SGAir0187]|uniref:restriction endonuclease subunit S n=1 Tax=Enterobacter sp. SGAir0187 TaxID=2836161 RepID=UPI000CEB4319|nr:restriction endonuclease subunit S [Enterobacter sp. SGAir0187]AVH17385.1 restriction endonuclease subunit S [Enterobacter sp. SGAir0187]